MVERSACSFAAAMFDSDGSMPITWAPSRASGSDNRPAPQPMSRIRKPPSEARLRGLRLNFRQAVSRIQASRSGLILCSGAILPFGSHHSSESFEKRATAAGSTVEGPPGLLDCGDMPVATLPRRDVVAELNRRTDHFDVLVALADAADGHIAIVEDAGGNRLLDVDALDLVEVHLERLALDEALLVHDP